MPKLFAGDSSQDNSEIKQLLSGKTGQATLELLLADKDLEKLALYWVKGVRIAWRPMHRGQVARLVDLPAYPFDCQSYWLPDGTGEPGAARTFAVDAGLSTADNVERYLAHCLGELLGIAMGTLEAAKTLQDYGVDSVSATKLRRGLEQIFNVKITARDMLTCPDLGALTRLVVRKNDDAVTASPAARPLLPSGQLSGRLSEGQKGLWLLHQMTPHMSAYNVPLALRFEAGLDVEAFRRACEHMLRRFPVLGSVFVCDEDGEPYQTVPARPRLDFEHRRSEVAGESEIAALLREKSKQPFDLERGPVLRACVISPASGRTRLALIVVHHVVFDGSSALLLMKALGEAYRELLAGRSPHLPASAADYSDFVGWQGEFLASGEGRRQLDYWKQQLSGDLPIVSLPLDHRRPARRAFKGASHEQTIGPELSRQAKALARALQVNPSVVFLGVFCVLLQRYSGDDEVVVGMPTTGRPASRFDDVVGFFVNMLCVRSRVSGPQRVGDFLKELQLTLADGLDNADYPFPALLRELGIEREPRVMFAYQNFIQPADAAAQAGLPFELLAGVNQEGTHDLALEVYQAADSYLLKLDYDVELFEPDTIRRTMMHCISLLEQVVSSPDAAIADLSLLSLQERRQILSCSHGGDPGFDTVSDLIELFQRQATLTPDATALEFEGRSQSYLELARRSTELARRLPGDCTIGVRLEQGFDMIVAMFAIWKAGAVYVPVSPAWPPERLRHVIDDCGMKLLITDAEAPVELRASTSAGTPPPGGLEQAAYVIYTSGSTGQPKGVAISHRSIAHHCQVMRDHYRLTVQDKVLQFASMSFDASLEQILPGLICGATVVLRQEELWSALEFRRAVEERGLTAIDVPPSYLHELLLDTARADDWAALASLRLVIVGGEALKPETLGLWRDGPMAARCRLVNAYGPTETTITSIAGDVGDAGDISIGRPLPGERAYILDCCGQPVPAGVPGELHIGGAGLALGYLNRPDLAAGKFIDDPFEPGSRLYRTGDRARWLADGTIAVLGRLDDQVKIRGFRVECGEVEAALRRLDAIREAAVLLRSVSGSEQLVAFVERRFEPEVDLKQALASTLPDYMIPSIVVSLDALPLTPGGKVDRANLKQRDLAGAQAPGRVEPRTPIEERLAAIWRQLLDLEQVGVTDNFFDLGGHSLLAVRLVALLHRHFGRELPVSSLFEAPDITRQALLLRQEEGTWSPLVRLKPGGSKAPVFLVHAVEGNVLAYRELSRCLSERGGRQRPLYALQSPDGDAHPGTVEGLAALYLDAIRNVQPNGPYHLGGWSMGGVIAYEMARQLQQAGEQVAFLALIDSYTPEAARTLAMPDQGMQANVRAMDCYTPGSYAGDVTLFSAGGAANGWSNGTVPRLRIVAVPGDHYSVLGEPNVRYLAERLKYHLNGQAS